MKSATKVDRYVDACREVAAWQRTIETEGETPARLKALLLARGRRTEYERTLTGGELGQARRILATPAAQQ